MSDRWCRKCEPPQLTIEVRIGSPESVLWLDHVGAGWHDNEFAFQEGGEPVTTFALHRHQPGDAPPTPAVAEDKERKP